MKPIVPHIILFLTLCSCNLSEYTIKKTYPEWWKNKETTTARIDTIYKVNNQLISYSFEVNGKEYSGIRTYENTKNWTEDIEVNVAYSPSFPEEKNKLLLHTKKLPDTTRLAYAIATLEPVFIISEYKDVNLIRVEYEYRVLPNSRIYKAAGFFPDSTKTLTSDDLKHNSYLVSYDIDFPKRNQIHLDKPFKDTSVLYATYNSFAKVRLQNTALNTRENGDIYWFPNPGETDENYYKKRLYADQISSEYNVQIHVFTNQYHYSETQLTNPFSNRRNNDFWYE